MRDAQTPDAAATGGITPLLVGRPARDGGAVVSDLSGRNGLRRTTLVVLIDPKPLRREGIGNLLVLKNGNLAVRLFADGAAFLVDEPVNGARADVILLSTGGADLDDAWVSGQMRLIADRAPDIPLVILSDREDAVDVARVLASGVRAYIPTSMAAAVAIEVLNLVLAGGTFVPAHILKNAMPRSDGQPSEMPKRAEPELLVDLTPRQRQVLQLISLGKQNKVIAHALRMEEGTVKVHLREIMRKLKAQNRTQVALLAGRLLANSCTDIAPAAAPGGGSDSVAEPAQGIGTSNLTGSDTRTK